MEQWLTDLMQSAPIMPYAVVVGILLISGFGAPIPEDIPLLLGGLSCGLKNEAGEPYANIYLMVPIAMVAVLGADLLLFWVGRRYGYAVTKSRWFRRFLNEKHLQKAEHAFHRNGGWALFVARFLPGLRAATFFSAGVFKIPTWKMIVFDGGAALISVPALVIVAYAFADRYEQVKEASKEVQLLVILGIVLLVVGIISFKVWKHRRKKAAEALEQKAQVRPALKKPILQKPTTRPKLPNSVQGG